MSFEILELGELDRNRIRFQNLGELDKTSFGMITSNNQKLPLIGKDIIDF